VNRLLIACCAALALLVLPSAARAESVKVYFTRGEQLVSATREAEEGPEAAIKALLAGPTTAERKKGYGTTIPTTVTLTSAVVDADEDTKVAVTLSNDFAAADVRYLARVAQLVYTLNAAGFETVTVRGHDFTRDDFRAPEDYEAPKTPTVKIKVSATRTVQKRLAARGYLASDAITGKYDYRTQQAVMAFQAWEGLDRDGVAGAETQARLIKAGRPKPDDEDVEGKSVEIYRDRGVLLLIEDGKVVRAIHTSTGVGQNSTDLGTPTGTFEITRKEQRSWSVPYKTWQPYAAYWANGGSFYGSPDVPAAPASFGGARVPLPEAKTVWGFVDVGTPVTVL